MFFRVKTISVCQISIYFVGHDFYRENASWRVLLMTRTNLLFLWLICQTLSTAAVANNGDHIGQARRTGRREVGGGSREKICTVIWGAESQTAVDVWALRPVTITCIRYKNNVYIMYVYVYYACYTRVYGCVQFTRGWRISRSFTKKRYVTLGHRAVSFPRRLGQSTFENN